MKLAIIGIRYTDPVNKIVFNDYRLVESTIFNWFNRENLFIFDEIISGGQSAQTAWVQSLQMITE